MKHNFVTGKDGEIEWALVPEDDKRIVTPTPDEVQAYWLRRIASNTGSMRGWVAFMGMVVLIGVIASLLF